ncbi:hypothetical protein [Flavobacterium polysaccharolyticum]|uniref:Lipoprotein n=1 Tax=Flavobacterium polysaccharolyticum TaxID=3133148 RepID=A0ABU9NUA9_9FLAO
MKKSVVVSVLVLFLVACEGKKEVQLPKSNQSLLTTIGEHSPVYIFFALKGKDTIADLNRSNTISSTHWVFNIDKRLPLRLVIPQVVKMQTKKEKSMHKSETSENYFSYADSLHKNLAFVSFTNVTYKMEKPKLAILILFTQNNSVIIDDKELDKVALQDYLNQLPSDKPRTLYFGFAKESSFGSYLQAQIFISGLQFVGFDVNSPRQEFIF